MVKHRFIACAHAQQLIWQLFNAVEKGFTAAGDTDAGFLDGWRISHLLTLKGLHTNRAEVLSKRARMDKGIHIGSWGQLQGIQSYARVVKSSV